MLLELLIAATGGLLLIVIGVAIVEACKAQWVFWRFQRETKGLPMTDKRNIFCNHAIRWGLCKNLCNELLDFYSNETNPRAVGWLLGNNYAACTVDLNLMKRIIMDEPNKNVNRIEINAPMAEYMEDNILLAADDQWRRLRRAVAPALRPNKFMAPNVVDELETSLGKLFDALESKLDEQTTGSAADGGICVEVDELMHRYSLDLVFRCFYKQYDLIDFTAKECYWTHVVDKGLEEVQHNPLIRFALMLKPLKGFVDWCIMNFHPQGKWRREIIRFIRIHLQLSIKARKRLRELKAAGRSVPDEDNFLLEDGTRFKRNMADHVTDHLLDGKITEREYLNTSAFLLMAADKTTADALTHIVYQLGVNRAIQAKARSAVRNEGPDAEYLGWVIYEGLRLMPPAPIGCSRAVAERTEIHNGHVLPAGTFVVFCNYVIHHLKKYWGDDAHEFKPERFAKAAEWHPMQFAPFGAGVRMCPGREFALHEMRQLLSRLLLRYEFECQPRADVFTFDSPMLVYLIPNSLTQMRIQRLTPETLAAAN